MPHAFRSLRLLPRLRRRMRDVRGDAELLLDVLRNDDRSFATLADMFAALIQYRVTLQDYFPFQLDSLPRSQWGSFASKREFVKFQNRLNKPEYHHLLANKLDYHARCIEHGIPAPDLLAVIFCPSDKRHRLPPSVRFLDSEEDLRIFLRQLGQPIHLIFKTARGSHGESMMSIKVEQESLIDLACGRQIELQQLWGHCVAHRSAGGFLVQEFLVPHVDLQKIMPGQALGAVRIITALRKGQVTVPFALIRIPTGANIKDDFERGRSGNLLAAVDLRNGTIGAAFGPSLPATYRLTEYPTHPDTGAVIMGTQIPQWKQIREMVDHAARVFSELKTVGWDVAVTQNGLFILEGNHNWDPHGVQTTVRHGIKDYMTTLAREEWQMPR